MSVYYPEQRPASKLSVIQREVALPENASGVVAVKVEQRVDVRDVLARGLVPGHFVVVDARAFFKLKKAADLEPLMQVSVDDEVTARKVLAASRGKKLLSPIEGRVALVTDGLIIIEQLNTVIDLEAGLRGKVISVKAGRSALVEATGTHIQGVWGNGGRAIAVVVNEGQNPIEKTAVDLMGSRYSNTVLVLRRPLTEDILEAAAAQSVAALIAPGMPVDLMAWALLQPFAVMIVEGFGAARLDRMVSQILQELEGAQVTVDAVQPQLWEARRPEVVMNVQPKGSEVPSRPVVNLTLRAGMTVRLWGGDVSGILGTVVNLPNEPVLLDNGLRVPCALVELGGDKRQLFVPLANLEVIG
jgi:hypothetical protein